MKFIKDRRNILIIICTLIIILLLIFKVINPKLGKEVNTSNKESLVCENTTSDLYKVTYNIKYKDAKTNKITIKYENSKEIIDYDNYSETNTQMTYYILLENSEYEYVNSNLIVTLTNKTYKSNKNDENIKKLFKSYSSAKKYLESLGYLCE